MIDGYDNVSNAKGSDERMLITEMIQRWFCYAIQYVQYIHTFNACYDCSI